MQLQKEPKVFPYNGVEPNKEALIYLYSRLPFLIRKAEQLVTTIFAEENSNSITLLQFHFLYILEHISPMKQVELCRLIGTDSSTASFVLKNLAKQNLIDRFIDDNDRRRKISFILPKGQKVLKASHNAFLKTHNALMNPILDKTELLLDLLEKLLDSNNLNEEYISAINKWGDNKQQFLQNIFRSPNFLFRRALQVMDIYAKKELSESDITIRQFAALLLIATHQNSSESDLVKLVGLEASNASFMIKLLYKHKLIFITSVLGKRKKQYAISSLGSQKLIEAGLAMKQAEKSLLDPLNKVETKELRKLLAAIISEFNSNGNSSMPLFKKIVLSKAWPKESTSINFSNSKILFAVNENSKGILSETCIPELVIQLNFITENIFDLPLKDNNISRNHFILLKLIERMEAVSLSKLSSVFHLTKTDLNLNLNQLLELKIITFSISQSKNVKDKICLTPKGIKLLTTIRIQHDITGKNLFKFLSKKQINHIQSSLDILNKTVEFS